jgi:hypothetical protein
MEILTAEMQRDAEELAQFRAGTRAERAFLCWRQVFDMKKYCALALVLALLVVVQLLQLVEMADFKQLFATYRHFYPVVNATVVNATGGE